MLFELFPVMLGLMGTRSVLLEQLSLFTPNQFPYMYVLQIMKQRVINLVNDHHGWFVVEFFIMEIVLVLSLRLSKVKN